ncbi:MAG: tRNA preQ1(34) S-adenosylmethionine ribosyltransferase-isomerase QueA [Verrucomicrobia bacterium]|nr:tRNA preQ1(34) S-adenosylmethionine ribosyltransferase-isomerase QueA [Verrucomicrobiota bacterium]
MRPADFHYDLPPELIAQHPAPHREDARLLVLHRADDRREHRRFPDLLDYLRAGDLLVLNNSRVLPARLRGRKPASGGEVEVLLVEENAPERLVGHAPTWQARPGRNANRVWPLGGRTRTRTKDQGPGTANLEPPTSNFQLRTSDFALRPSPSALRPSPSRVRLAAVVIAKNDEGHYRLRFEGVADVRTELERYGEVPLPPYIERSSGPSAADRERYQTVFAKSPGSVAAPTAGLHFTEALLDRIRGRGVQIVFVTLHVGLGTFAPIKAAHLADHVMHEELFEVPSETAAAVQAARRDGRRVIAVGTTSVRVLESVDWSVVPAHPPPEGGASIRGRTRLFIHPPRRFQVVNALVTNFHLPASTLLMLVCAFAAPGETRGRERVLEAYAEAVRERYRFFSYGDAMLIL